MAAIPVTIVGTMTYAGLEIGGGPIVGPPGGSPGYPAHPIAPGGPPPGIWPGPGYPAHPIAPGGPPPGIWGPPGPWPTPPIFIPPGGGGGSPPLGIWGPTDPRPTPPIYITVGDGENQKKYEMKAVYHPTAGWITVWVPAEDTTAPTPS
jgi:hypothetical protein